MLPGRREGCSTWSHGADCDSVDRNRCNEARLWRGWGAWENQGQGATDGLRKDWRWSTEQMRG